VRLDATTGAELETIAYDPKSNTAGILLDDDTKEVRGAGRECPRAAERQPRGSRDQPRSAEISRDQPRSAEIRRDQPRSAEISRILSSTKEVR